MHKKELELLINQRAEANMFKNAPVTEASMTGLRMLPEHAEKLMLQEPSPLKKYAQPHNGMLSALVDNEYTRRHR